MRIISGKWKGLRIVAPAQLPVRPTTDMAKESLFNWLGNYLEWENIVALDLCSGTGNIAFEMLSRGASHVSAVDKDHRCVNFIAAKAKELKCEKQISIYKTDCIIALERLAKPTEFIFADPPYDFDGYDVLAAQLFACKNWIKGGFAVIEHPKEVNFNTLNPVDNRSYGKVCFTLFENR